MKTTVANHYEDGVNTSRTTTHEYADGSKDILNQDVVHTVLGLELGAINTQETHITPGGDSSTKTYKR